MNQSDEHKPAIAPNIAPDSAPGIANGIAYTSEKKAGLQTDYQKHRAKRDKDVHDRYHQLMAQSGAMATEVQRKVMREFNIHAVSTVYRTLERVSGGSGVEGKV